MSSASGIGKSRPRFAPIGLDRLPAPHDRVVVDNEVRP